MRHELKVREGWSDTVACCPCGAMSMKFAGNARTARESLASWFSRHVQMPNLTRKAFPKPW